MDQKNTIVKCNRSPKCLFEHNGVCDNYVIHIDSDGQCACYVETARIDNFGISEIEEIAIYKPGSKEPLLTLKEPQRGQRAKCNFYEDGLVDPEIVKEVCKPFTMSDHLCDIRCISAHYAEDGELYCALQQNFPERPLRCSAYDDGGEG